MAKISLNPKEAVNLAMVILGSQNPFMPGIFISFKKGNEIMSACLVTELLTVSDKIKFRAFVKLLEPIVLPIVEQVIADHLANPGSNVIDIFNEYASNAEPKEIEFEKLPIASIGNVVSHFDYYDALQKILE